MKKILKSFMISFVKSWVETIGTILFLLMLCAIVLGMLTTPLQINFKIHAVQDASHTPDSFIKVDARAFNDDFIEEFFLNEAKPYHYSDANITLAPSNFPEGLEGIDPLNHDNPEVLATDGDNDEAKNEAISKIKNELNQTFLDFTAEPTSDSVLSAELLTYIHDKCENSLPLQIMRAVLDQNADAFAYGYDYQYTLNYGDSPNVISFDVRPTDNAADLSQVVLDQGRLPVDGVNANGNYEAVVSSAYFKANKMELGDILNVPAFKDGHRIEIVGVGGNYETILNGEGSSIFNGSDVDTYGFLYLTHNNITTIYNSNPTSKSTLISNQKIRIRVKQLGETTLSDVFYTDVQNNKGIFITNGSGWLSASEYATIKGLENIKIQVIIYIVLGIIVLVLAFIFINFIIKKELNQSRVQIGIFKAMGYTHRELSWIFALKTLITIFIGIILGYVVSIPLQIYAAGQFESSVAIGFAKVYASPLFLFILWICIPLFFMGISYLLTLRDLKESSLDLMNNAVRENKRNYFLLVMSVILFPFGIIQLINRLRSYIYQRSSRRFTWRMRYSFTKSGQGKFVMVLTLIAFSAFMFMALISASGVMNTLIKQGFNTINDKADYSLSWAGQNSMKVTQTKDGKNILDLNEDYYTSVDEKDSINGAWQPNDVQYIDYSGQGYAKTVAENFDMPKVGNISSMFDAVINHYFKDGAPSVENGMNLNVLRALLSLISLNVNDYTFDAYDKANSMADILAAAFGLLTLGNDNLWNTLGKDETDGKQFAIKMKDIGKLSCVTTQLTNVDGKLPDCTKQSEWLSSATNSSENGSGNNNTSNDTSGNVGMFGSLAAISMMLSDDENYDPLITTNSFLYDKTKDLMYYQVLGTKQDGQNIGTPVFRLIDADENNDKYGNIRNGFNISSDAYAKMSQLIANRTSDEPNSEANPISAITSYRFSRGLDKNIGDVVKIFIGDTIKVPVYVKIVGIDKNDTFASNITVDNETFIKQITEVDTNLLTENKIFNSIVSQNVAMTGDIDLNNIAESIRSIKVSLDNFSIAYSNSKSMFQSLLKPVLSSLGYMGGTSDLLFGKKDDRINLLNNVSLTNMGGMNDEVQEAQFSPFRITQALVNQISNIATMMMTIFILLDAVLLLIILIVIMNIVVDESQRIILTMRSIGYKNRQINWMVMGNYIIWTVISFVISYILIILTWVLVSNVIWSNFSILISLPLTADIPLIAFFVIAVIMGSGWIAAMQRINRHPLTAITD
jgi:putative ABC transport system permease protein